MVYFSVVYGSLQLRVLCPAPQLLRLLWSLKHDTISYRHGGNFYAVLVSARPNVAICSLHELEQLARKAELLHRSSSCLELTAASPSLPVHQSQSFSSRAQDSSFQTGLSLLTCPLRTTGTEEIESELNCLKCNVSTTDLFRSVEQVIVTSQQIHGLKSSQLQHL